MTKEFEVLLEHYWDLAYLEGKSGISQGDKANDLLHALKKLAAQPQQDTFQTDPEDQAYANDHEATYGENYAEDEAPVQEPVAWCTKSDLENMAKGFIQGVPARAMRVPQLYPKKSTVLLYTPPAQRKPPTTSRRTHEY